MTRRAAFLRGLLPLALLLLCGCGGGGGDAPAAPVIIGPDPTALSVSAKTSDELTATLAQDNYILAKKDTVTYTMTLANASAVTVTVPSPGTINGRPVPSVALSIMDAQGKSVFPQGYPATVPAPMPPATTVSLTPGGFLSETLTLPGVFPAAGRYSASAVFITSGGAKTTAGPLVITAR